MSKIYYIDTENLPYWEMSISTEKGDFVYIFKTINSREVHEKVLQKITESGANYKLVDCDTGRNALDFQLVSTLGFILKSNKKKEHIILSCDKGYNAIINFWNKRGYNVSLEEHFESRSRIEYKKFLSYYREKEAKNLINEFLNRFDFDEESKSELKNIILDNIHKKHYKDSIHSELIKFLGSEQGTDTYKVLKKEKILQKTKTFLN